MVSRDDLYLGVSGNVGVLVLEIVLEYFLELLWEGLEVSKKTYEFI